jgi:glycosyltransferase involved in cell wall biosynthesis
MTEVKCIIGGIGQPGYVEKLKARISKFNRISFAGRVPFAEVLPLTQNSDAVFCMVDPVNFNSKISMPNKLFEAMVCGRPLICTAGTYSGDFVEREEIGIAIDFNEQSLREAIIKLRDNPASCESMGRNALNAAINKYNWQIEKEKLIALYRNLKQEACEST